MNHGGTAYVAFERLRLSADLLVPLSIVEGTPLKGFYYPTPDSYKDVRPHNDLMLTPIPYWAWPHSAGLRLELKHQKGALTKIAEYLKEQNLNIQITQCTRSGHRYATWNLVVEFEDLRGTPPEDIAELLPEKVRQLEAQIQHDCGDFLQEQNSPELRAPVFGWALRALNHFYRKSQENPHRLFNAYCKAHYTLDISDASTISEWAELNHRNELPTLGFVNLDTEHFLIRVAALKKSDMERFRSIKIRYSLNKRTRDKVSSRGVLHSLTDILRDEWNMWRIYGESKIETEHIEQHQVHLFIEREAGSTGNDESVLQALTAIGKQHRNLTVEETTIRPISLRRIFISIRNENAFRKRNDILYLCKKVAEEIGILETVTVDDHTSGSTTQNVAQKIAQCQGMLQFYIGSAEEPLMDWLNAEFFLAHYLNLPRIRIADESLVHRITFERDRAPIHVSPDASDKRFEDAIRAAFFELDQEMRGQY